MLLNNQRLPADERGYACHRQVAFLHWLEVATQYLAQQRMHRQQRADPGKLCTSSEIYDRLCCFEGNIVFGFARFVATMLSSQNVHCAADPWFACFNNLETKLTSTALDSKVYLDGGILDVSINCPNTYAKFFSKTCRGNKSFRLQLC